MSTTFITQSRETKDFELSTPKSESDIGHTSDEGPQEKEAVEPEVTYPEGGARGWAVAAGSAGILFSTFGYANSFGYSDLFSMQPETVLT